MARKVVQLDLTTGELVVTPAMVEASEVDTTPTANGIPRADGAGKIAAGWIPDAVRTVNVQEPDGVPALTAIDTLVFDAGTVAFLGGGTARITGGGGDTINLQGRPVAANAPELGQALVWGGAQWAPGTVAGGGGGSDWLTSVQLIGLVDGVNRTFDLPAPAVPSSLLVFLDVGGMLTAATYTGPLYENMVFGVTPEVSGNYANGGYYGSSPASCLVDGNTTWTPHWSSAYVVPVMQWHLSTPVTLARVAVYAYTTSYYGYWGGLTTYKVECSDDGVVWTTIATDVGTQGYHALPDAGPRAWWRITGLTKANAYEWAVAEVILDKAVEVTTAITFDTAPAVGSIPRASFRIAPTLATGGGSSGTDSGPGGVLALFDRFW